MYRGGTDVKRANKSMDEFVRTLPIERRSYREENRCESGVQRGFSFIMKYTRVCLKDDRGEYKLINTENGLVAVIKDVGGWVRGEGTKRDKLVNC